MNRIKSRLVSLLSVSLLMVGGGLAVASPAAAASPDECQPPASLCYFMHWAASQGGPYGISETWYATLPRNTCYQLTDFNDNAYVNATTVYWYAFRTTTCGGSHIAHAPGAAGQFPAGWNNGAIHAVMRTSTT